MHPTRRDIVMGGAALTLGGTPSRAEIEGTSPGGGRTVLGTVVERKAGGGTAPLKDVLVSNGRDVVRTDADGRYRLPIAPGQVVFVVKPTGFQPPLNPATKLPQISFVYDPDGTPAEPVFRYGGLRPTGPLPASVDFHLSRVAEPDTFDVILFTDPQPESTAEIEFVRDAVVSGLVGSKAAFGITCGDIAFDDLGMYGRINRVVGAIGLPWWNVGGNHDLDFEAADARRSRDTFKQAFGAPYYAHEYGGVLFVMLDNVDYFGAEHRRSRPEPHYRGWLSADQLAFVRNLLAETPRDRPLVFVMHIPLRTYLGSDDERNTVNAADLLALIGDRPAVSFAGHTHSTEHHYLGAADGFSGKDAHHHQVLTAVSGSWWSGPRDHRGIACADSYDGSPNGFHVLSVTRGACSTRFVAATEPGRQMRISLETQFHQDERAVEFELPMVEVLRSPITAEQARGTRLVVNVFDGGPKTRVTFTIAGAAPVEMTKVARPDPFIVQVYGRHRETIKPWVRPQISSHLWSASLPQGLGAGAYAVEVEAIDEYGRRHADGMVLEIA